MSVILKKDEKISAVVNSLGSSFSTEEFIARFQELYPKEWSKIEKNYLEHEKKTKLGKSHPMPEPTQYLKNALHVWQNKNKKT